MSSFFCLPELKLGLSKCDVFKMETVRVKFEVIKDSHLHALNELFCQNEVVMKSTLKGKVFTEDEFNKLLEEEFCTTKSNVSGFRCIISKLTNTVIGVSGLLECNYLNMNGFEFGFILNENQWGKGLATEIGEFWLDYAKNELKLTELFATVSPNNRASQRVLEKLNMEYIGKVNSNDRGERLIMQKKL